MNDEQLHNFIYSLSINAVVIAVLFLGKGPTVGAVLAFNFYFFTASILVAPFVSDAVETWVEKGTLIIGRVLREPFDVLVTLAGWYVISFGLLATVYRFGMGYVSY